MGLLVVDLLLGILMILIMYTYHVYPVTILASLLVTVLLLWVLTISAFIQLLYHQMGLSSFPSITCRDSGLLMSTWFVVVLYVPFCRVFVRVFVLVMSL